MNRAQSEIAHDFVYVDQESFERYRPRRFSDLLSAFREYKDSSP